MPADVPARAARQLLAIAQKPSLAPAVRIDGDRRRWRRCARVTRVDDKALAALLADRRRGDPPRRRRGAGRRRPRATSRSSDALAEDAVARRGGGGGRVAVPRRAGDRARGQSEPGARRARRKLGAAARERLRSLALDEKVSLADRLDLVGCLRVGKKDADQKVLDELARGRPTRCASGARALGGR